MTEPYETGRPAEVDIDSVSTREDLVEVIQDMLNDLRKNPDAWGNADLDDYLEALAASVEDAGPAEPERGEEQPSWRMMADLLVRASAYE